MSVMLSNNQVLEWARGYIRAYEAPDPALGEDELSRYVLGLMPGPENLDPEDAWRVILAVLWLEPSPPVIGILAAGPLEDLIQYQGESFIGRIEEEARQNPAFSTSAWWCLGKRHRGNMGSRRQSESRGTLVGRRCDRCSFLGGLW